MAAEFLFNSSSILNPFILNFILKNCEIQIYLNFNTNKRHIERNIFTSLEDKVPLLFFFLEF